MTLIESVFGTAFTVDMTMYVSPTAFASTRTRLAFALSGASGRTLLESRDVHVRATPVSVVFAALTTVPVTVAMSSRLVSVAGDMDNVTLSGSLEIVT